VKRYYPSLLILKGKRKRRRIRPRRSSLNAAVVDQRLSDLEWAEDKREREGSRIVSVWLQIGTIGYTISDLQQRDREKAAQIGLNSTKLDLLEARQVPGWTASDKRRHWDLTHKNSEELHDLREEVRLMHEIQRIRASWAEQIERRLGNLERAFGEDSDV
jgi:hypothetical protein